MAVTVHCEHAIRRGIDFLRRRHRPNGEFTTLVGPNPDLGPESRYEPSIFTTVNVATSLLEVPGGLADDLLRKAAVFLRSEMLTSGLWCFWSRMHPGRRGMPPDVDDTSCVSDLLRRLGVGFPDNRRMLDANRQRDGLFWTWIVPRLRHVTFPQGRNFLARAVPSAPARCRFFRSGPEPPPKGSVDCVVNCNTLLYLGDDTVTADAAAWVTAVIRAGTAALADRFYQSDIALLYSAARCVERGLASMRPVSELIGSKAEAVDCSALTSLEVGQVASALMAVGCHSPRLEACIDVVLGMQDEDGGWPACVSYYDDYGRAWAWGSRELTTGFCLESLSRFLQVGAPAR